MASCESGLPFLHEPAKDTKNISTKRSNCCVWVIVLCFALVVNFMACSLVFLYTRSELKDMKENSANLERQLSQLREEYITAQTLPVQEDDYDDDDNGAEDETEDEETYNPHQAAGIHHLKKRSQKASHPQLKVPPFVHLVGREGYMITEEDTTYFPWNKSQHNQGIHGFELIGDSEKGFYKIKVRNQGVYIVFSQVAVHGRKTVTQPNECSHETVCERKGTAEKIVLLSSLITQYQLGASYESNVHNDFLRALDTKVHMGVFLLNKDDELSVQVPKNCGNMEYSLTDTQSYFGVAELSHKWEKTPRPTKKPKLQTQKEHTLKKAKQ